MKHVMLDLETLGSNNRAPVIAIGAVEFNPFQVVDVLPGETFYVAVDPEDAAKYGQVDIATIVWWMKQSDEARKAAFSGTTRLKDALKGFNDFLRTSGNPGEYAPNQIAVWGNGATFDNVVIRSAYAAAYLTPAWSFRGDKCYRTVWNLLPESRRPPFKREGTHHNALDDAVTQAKALQLVYRELGITSE